MSIIEKAAQRLTERNDRPDAGPPPVDLADPGAASGGELVPPASRANGGNGSDPMSASSAEPMLKLRELGIEMLMSPEGGRTRTAEEFRMIKRPLLVNAFDRNAAHQAHPNLIMVTSSVQGEGKTFTSLNLAVSITMELDSTVLLVDADVARPGLSKVLGLVDEPGLLDRLIDERCGLSGLLLRTDIPKLTVLPAGTRHRRSTELLASGTMRRMLDELASRYSDRIVLFDSPPLLETSEASVLASQMGQVIIVVESETTSQGLVREALERFENTDNVYLVLNKCKESLFAGRYGYGYGYGYGYSYGSYGEQQ
jgi:exopolysaccharide/PEP-CTERM locus tyrosine autokinase